jgi:hypothetical protein
MYQQGIIYYAITFTGFFVGSMVSHSNDRFVDDLILPFPDLAIHTRGMVLAPAIYNLDIRANGNVKITS